MQLLQFVITSYYEKSYTETTHSHAHGIDHEKIGSHEGHQHHHAGMDSVKMDEKNQKRIAVILLEVGIALHSMIIGISLGVSSGSEFTALAIALSFHQFFEGLALGTTVIEAQFESAIKSVLMTLIYGITTPLGICIGIAIHSSFNPNSVEGLLSIGIVDSFSAGVLIYTALVEFLTPEITNSVSFRQNPVWKQLILFGSVYLGVTVMAIIGKFA